MVAAQDMPCSQDMTWGPCMMQVAGLQGLVPPSLHPPEGVLVIHLYAPMAGAELVAGPESRAPSLCRLGICSVLVRMRGVFICESCVDCLAEFGDFVGPCS